MAEDGDGSSVAIDLSRLHRRTLTSFYSNLVTRPTGRAVRMGVESQLADLDPADKACLSVLDFSQVQVLDYSCADEIVAKLTPELRGGEVVLVMSNGGFGGIHGKLPDALGRDAGG